MQLWPAGTTALLTHPLHVRLDQPLGWGHRIHGLPKCLGRLLCLEPAGATRRSGCSRRAARRGRARASSADPRGPAAPARSCRRRAPCGRRRWRGRARGGHGRPPRGGARRDEPCRRSLRRRSSTSHPALLASHDVHRTRSSQGSPPVASMAPLCAGRGKLTSELAGLLHAHSPSARARARARARASNAQATFICRPTLP